MYDFGLTNDQFWQLTPAQFAALSHRHEQRAKQEDLRTGIIASSLWNVARSICGASEGEPFTPQQFMPTYDGEEVPEPRKTGQSVEEMRRRFMLQFPPTPITPEAHG